MTATVNCRDDLDKVVYDSDDWWDNEPRPAPRFPFADYEAATAELADVGEYPPD